MEVVYTLARPGEYAARAARARQDNTRERYQLMEYLATTLLRHLDNGFVVFQPEYVTKLEAVVKALEFGEGVRLLKLDWPDVLQRIRGL